MQKLHICFFILGFFIAANLFGQEPKIDSLIKVAITLREQGAFKKALQVAEEALGKAQKVKYPKGIADSYVQIGNIHKNFTQDFRSAHNAYDEALKIRKVTLKDSLGAGMILNNQIDLFLKENQVSAALVKSREAIEWLSKSQNGELGLAKAYNNTANVYNQLNELDSAILNNQKSIDLLPATQDSLTWAQACYGLGKRYYLKNQKAKSKKFFLNATYYFEKNGYTYNAADAYNALGVLYRGENSDSARINLKKAIQLAKQNEDFDILSNAYFNLGLVEQSEFKYDAALVFLDTAESYYKQIEHSNTEALSKFSTDYLININQTKQSIFNQKGRYRAQNTTYLVICFAALIIATFSLLLIVRRAKLKLLEANNNILIANNNILIANNNKLIDDKVKSYMLDNKQMRIEAFQVERKSIGRILHDQISTRLTVIKWNLESLLKDKETSDLGLEDQVTPIINTVQETYSEVYQLYHGISHYDGKWLDAIKGFHLAMSNQIETIDFSIERDIEKKVPAAIGEQVEAIIIELTTNAIKHANAKSLFVNVYSDRGNLMLSIQDDGKGFDLESSDKHSGLENIQTRVAELNGTVDIDSGKGAGTTITIEIPIA